MDDFQPRIEDPPSQAARVKASAEVVALRDFVVRAAGAWCLVGQVVTPPGVSTLDRVACGKLRSRMYLVLKAWFKKNGADCEMRTVSEGRIYKVYARYIAPNSNPKQETK